METGSILIKEKRTHLSKMSDRVSQMFCSTSAQGLKGRKNSILIKEKRKHLSKMSDRVSQMFWSASTQSLKVSKNS